MDPSQFWRLIEATFGDADRAEALAASLEALPADDIVHFRIIYDRLVESANKVNLRGAAYTINGSCTDDEFYYFRAALIESGRNVFEAAVADPDSLADVAVPGEKIDGTDIAGIAPIVAWTAKTGETEDAFFEAVDIADQAGHDDVEDGEWWNFKKAADLRHHLPRLAAMYVKDPDE